MRSSTPSSGSRFPVSAVALTVFASVGLATLAARLMTSDAQPLQPQSTSNDQINEIVVRLDRIEQQLMESEVQVARAPGSPSEPPFEDVPDQQDFVDLNERLDRLERIEADRRAEAERRAEQRRLQVAQISAAASATMLDPLADEQMKAAAWGQIRGSSAEAWTDDIVAEAVRIGTTSAIPQIRADIWRQAHAGRTHSLLLQPLLHALANDPERSAREEAAETLDLYLDQPGVREALQLVSQYDEDEGVRRQALTSLAGPQGGF